MLSDLFGKKRKNNRVMVVEDDAMLSGVLAESLEAEKIKVLVVDNGLKVFEEALKFLPNVILLDLILPGIDGFAVLEQLQEDTKTRNIPVIVVSNLGEASDVKAARSLGAVEYFLKANTDVEVIVKSVLDKLKK